MTINWKQVLEIETYLTNIFEQNATIERFLWRHQQTINSGLRVDKAKLYSFDDLQIYLTTKFPKDEMIRKGTEMTMQLFQAKSFGVRLCKIDDELLDINENQDLYKLSNETLKNNLLSQCSEYTGSTSFFLYCLKIITDHFKIHLKSLKVDLKTKQKIESTFIGYVSQLVEFNPIYFKLNADEYNCDIECSDFIKITYQKLKDKTAEFIDDSRFKSYRSCCEKNNYIPPYSDKDFEIFHKDLMLFSVSEVIEIIRNDDNNYFGFKLRNNESQYPEDIRRSLYGNLNIYITLYGFLNFDSIREFRANGLILQKVKEMLSSAFIILPKESINDDFNPDLIISGNSMDSSLILGKDLSQKKLYNQFIDDYQEKVIDGFVWFNDDVHGIIYDYLGFNDSTDYKVEYKHLFPFENKVEYNTFPFENVISKYFIAYLNKSEWEREMDDDLRNEGYWLSKAEFEKEISDEFDDESNEWDSDEESNFSRDKMDKQYRVLNLNINKEDSTGLETLIAELSEIEINNIPGLSYTPYTFGATSGQIFILYPDSGLGKYLMNEPEVPKTLNLSEFKRGTVNLSEGQKDAYYHDEYIRRKSE